MTIRYAIALALIAAAIGAVTGCGGEAGRSTAGSNPSGAHSMASGDDANPPSISAGPPATSFHPRKHEDSGGGAAQFEVEEGDNSVQEFGSEASEAELRQAAGALHGFLDARAARNWAAACSYLAAGIVRSFAKIGEVASRHLPPGCAGALAALSDRLSATDLRKAAVADVGALRSDGSRGFAIYRGFGGTAYALSMSREDGKWRVASIGAVPLG